MGETGRGGDKTLDIIALTEIDAEFLKNTLLNHICEKISIKSHSIEKGLPPDINQARNVLLSGAFLKERVGGLIPRGNIIVAKRTITGQNLEKVLVLPKKKKVLVVNYPQEVTEETIESLKDLGLNHLNYIPYFGGKIMSTGIDTAISPGHIYLCPDFIKNRIDLGRRGLAFSTFVEVLQSLGLHADNLDNYGKNHIGLMVNAGKKVAQLLRDTETLRLNLEVVLGKIQEGIMTIDEKGRIVVINTLAGKMFNLEPRAIVGKPCQQALKDYPDITNFLTSRKQNKDCVFNIGDKKVMASSTVIDSFDKTNTICSFVEYSDIQRMEETIRRNIYKRGYIAKYSFADIIGNSMEIREAKKQAQKFAVNDLTIFISGESGTGKEMFAQAIHNASLRAQAPFIAVNFAALPETLVESELFGYEEGAFTGALKGGKAGLFEQAHKGTVFLDEIGDAPMAIQARLLRVLQEREVMRLGASKVIPVDVRIIAATNKDLQQLVREGRFRKDLYYRLKVLPIILPPLRNRKQETGYPVFNRKLHVQTKAT